MPALKAIARQLLNDIESVPERFILVMDDYHAIHNVAIHELLMELLIYPSRKMHLVIITRRDPILAVTNIRSQGMMTEISAKDLRFTIAETQSFLERLLKRSVSQNTAQALESKMEGWVTGLRLTALSIRNEADQERLIEGLQTTSQFVRDYLVLEVLENVPPQFKGYLLRASILDGIFSRCAMHFQESLLIACLPRLKHVLKHFSIGCWRQTCLSSLLMSKTNGFVFITFFTKS